MKFLRDKNILLISPEAWGKSMLSKHHYAEALCSAGNRVWFLQPENPASTVMSAISGLTILNDNYSIRGLRFIPSVIRKAIMKTQIKKLMADIGSEIDLVWSFDNSRFFDLDCFGDAYKIHHMMDYHVAYQLETASKTANLCLGVTSGIVEQLRTYNKNSHFIQHGYAPADVAPLKLPDSSQKIKALYTGNLLIQFIDWNWMKALIQSNPDVHFYFAGSYAPGNLNPSINAKTRSEVDAISKASNVTLLGECSPIEIQGYLQDADILFAAYKSREFPESTANAHKLMAYLGAGKPVVSSNIKEYDKPDSLLYMAHELDKFLETFNAIKTNLSSYNTPELIQQRKAWAMDNTYLRQIERIDQLIITT